MELQKGFRDKLNKYLNTSNEIEIFMRTDGEAIYDYSCFGVDGDNKLSNDKYMIFYNQESSPDNEIKYSEVKGGANFKINLEKLPEFIKKLVFTVSIDGAGTMGEIKSHNLNISQNNEVLINMDLNGGNFSKERAIISIEIYKKDEWRIACVASGFNGGLSDLLKFYGGEETKEEIKKEIKDEIKKTKKENQEIKNKNSKPVELRKGQKVNLEKNLPVINEIVINLNWNRGKKTFFKSPIDLDLGCLYELKNGMRGCIQALGRDLGSLDYPPYISLDGDDRTGDVIGGENLRINGLKISQIKRILVFTFIYEGVSKWQEADGVVILKCSGSRDVIVKMDEYETNKKMCAIAMLENVNDETFSVEKLINFFDNQEDMDKNYGWGLNWRPGRK